MDDTMQTTIPVGVVRGYGARDWKAIRECLHRWEAEGILKILCDPEDQPPETPCVEMLKYIHRRSPYPGFLNWDED